MNRYRVSHRTTYSYDEDVSDSLGIAYLVPRELPWQHVVSHELSLDPSTEDCTGDLDFYGNTSTYFQVTSPHQVLDILATSEVETEPPSHDEHTLDTPWESARPQRRADVADAWQAQDFALASALADQTTEAHAYAAQSLQSGRPVGEAVTDLMHRIHADFAYDKASTTVTTTIDDIFAQRAGSARTSRT